MVVGVKANFDEKASLPPARSAGESSGLFFLTVIQVLHHTVGVHFTIMTRSLYIIPLITWLFTKEINNLTQNIDLEMILLLPLKN